LPRSDSEKPVGDEPAQSFQITNKLLLEALASESTFDQLYHKITDRAIRGLTLANRSRTIRILKCDIAKLYFVRRKWRLACDMYQNMLRLVPDSSGGSSTQLVVDDLEGTAAAAISEGDVVEVNALNKDGSDVAPKVATKVLNESWGLIDTDILAKWAVCQKELCEFDDYIQSCIALLVYQDALSPQERKFYGDEIYSMATANRDYTIVRELSPMFLAKLDLGGGRSHANAYENRERGFTVQIFNSLGVSFKLEQVGVQFVGPHANDARFVSEAASVGLNPGWNTVAVYCDDTTTAGHYVAERVDLQVGSVRFSKGLLEDAHKHYFTIRETEETLNCSIGLSHFNSIRSDGDFPKAEYCASKELCIKVFTHKDTIAACSELDLSSSTLPFSSGKECLLRIVAQTAIESQQSVVTTTKILMSGHGKIVLPDEVASGHVLELIVPMESMCASSGISDPDLDHAPHSTARHQVR
jgi:hypothetical protein